MDFWKNLGRGNSWYQSAEVGIRTLLRDQGARGRAGGGQGGDKGRSRRALRATEKIWAFLEVGNIEGSEKRTRGHLSGSAG